MKNRKTDRKQLPAEQAPGAEAEQEEYVIWCGGIQPFGLYDFSDGEEDIPTDRACAPNKSFSAKKKPWQG